MFVIVLCQLKTLHKLFKRSKVCWKDIQVFWMEVEIWSLLIHNAKWKHVPALQLLLTFFFSDLSLDSWYVLYKLSCYLGELSLDEFIDGARRDKWVMKMLQMDVNPGDWLNDQRRSADF